MLEKKFSSLSVKEQKAMKMPFDDIIVECLDGDDKTIAFNFINYLKSMKMTARWANKNAWEVKYKGRGVCKIYVWDDNWFIRPSFNHNYNDALMTFITDNKLEEVIWNNIYHCRGCGKSPSACMIKLKSVLGKDFKGVCSCILFQFTNPDLVTLKCVEKLIAYRRYIIANHTDM